jgi:plasmid stability protein
MCCSAVWIFNWARCGFPHALGMLAWGGLRLRFRENAIMIATEAAMAQILVRNMEDRLKARLQRRAKRNGRSMEAEAREILRDALNAEDVRPRKLGSEIVALFSGQGIGLKEGEEIAEWRGYPVEPISFDE